jgi:hypothetical protein
MPRSTGQPTPWGPPDPTHETDRRRPGRHDYENERLLRLLRDPLAEPDPDSTDPTLLPPRVEPQRLSLRATVLAVLAFWCFAVLIAVLL